MTKINENCTKLKVNNLPVNIAFAAAAADDLKMKLEFAVVVIVVAAGSRRISFEVFLETSASWDCYADYDNHFGDVSYSLHACH